MARSKKRLVYLEPSLDDAIVARAEEAGISVNEWVNRVAEHYLLTKGKPITYIETKTVTL